MCLGAQQNQILIQKIDSNQSNQFNVIMPKDYSIQPKICLFSLKIIFYQYQESWLHKLIIMSLSRVTDKSHFLSGHANPIYIEDDFTMQKGKLISNIVTMGRLPSMSNDDKLTKLLYSKFIVKGVKAINQQAILQKVKKSKSLKQSTKQTTHYGKEIVVKQKNKIDKSNSCQSKAEKQMSIFQFSMENCLHKNVYKPQSKNLIEKQSKNFTRSQSAKDIKRPQTAIPKSSSVKTIIRPNSAYGSHSQEKINKNVRQRPSTAHSRNSNNFKGLKMNYEFHEESKPHLITISETNPSTDYILKNKQQLSNRKKSIYLTISQVPNSILPKSNNSISQNEQKMKKQQFKQNNEFTFPKHEVVTFKQRKMITEKQRQYLHYMRENMPYQYQQCINYLNGLNDQGFQQEKSLICQRIGQDQPLSMTSKQIEQFQVQNYYQDFLNKCIDVQYGIKKAKKQEPKILTCNNILNINDQEILLKYYQTLCELRQKKQNYQHIIQKIQNKVKSLIFFKSLKNKIFNKIFQMNFRIFQTEEDEYLIHNRSQITQVFIILKGSVTKKNYKNEDFDLSMINNKSEAPQFLMTLFDGQTFGLPNQNQDQVLNYSIKTIQRCIIMSFPYKEYRSALRNSQNIQDLIEILKDVFPNGSNSYQLKKQDYQSIAYQMQSLFFSSQQIISREGQQNTMLMIIGSGRVNICFESIIKRRKLNQNILKRKRNQIKKDIKIQDLRKSNLFNYQLLYQNNEECHYYYCTNVQQKIKSDVLNWKGFHQSFYNQGSSPFLIPYSLMSSQDNTKIYVLSRQKFDGLSQHIRKIILQRVKKYSQQQIFKRKDVSLEKWQKYKIKICQDVLKQKKNKFY